MLKKLKIKSVNILIVVLIFGITSPTTLVQCLVNDIIHSLIRVTSRVFSQQMTMLTSSKWLTFAAIYTVIAHPFIKAPINSSGVEKFDNIRQSTNEGTHFEGKCD